MRTTSNSLKVIGFLLLASVLYSCSSNDTDVDIDKPEIKKVKLSVTSKQTKANIYDLVTFNLVSNDDYTLLDVRNTYDSLVWTIPELGSTDVVWFSSNAGSQTWQWSHCFLIPGEYKAYTYGYKDGKCISTDSLSLEIENKKDFLMFDWSDDIKINEYATGYTTAFPKRRDWEHSTIARKQDDKIAVVLFATTSKDYEYEELIQNTKKHLDSYLEKIYGKPRYSVEKPTELKEQYETLFNIKPTAGEPFKIWLTPKSNIVLLKSKMGAGDNMYSVYAEPLKQ